MEFFGDDQQVVTGFDGVVAPADPLRRGQLCQFFLEAGAAARRHQQLLGPVGSRGPLQLPGIEFTQRLEAHVRQFGGPGEVYLPADFRHFKGRFIGYRGYFNRVALGFGDDPGQRQHLGHVAAGFTRQVQGPEIGGQAFFKIGLASPGYPAFTGVVGGQGQQPVIVKFAVQFFQVIQGDFGRVAHRAATVEPRVLLQAQVFPGLRHDLPEPRGLAGRVGERIERALDQRHQRYLHGHVALLHLLDNVVQVERAALGYLRQIIGLGQVAGHRQVNLPVVDLLLPTERGANPFPQIPCILRPLVSCCGCCRRRFWGPGRVAEIGGGAGVGVLGQRGGHGEGASGACRLAAGGQH